MAGSFWRASQSGARLPWTLAYPAHTPPRKFHFAALCQRKRRSPLAELERILRADVVSGVPLDGRQENDEGRCGQGKVAGVCRYVSRVETIPARLPARRLAGGP